MPEPPRTRIRLCGALAVELDGRAVSVPAGQPELLLAYLLAHRDRELDRGELIDVLWPDQPPRDPGAALRPILSRLRRALAPADIEGRDRVRIVLPEPVWVDVEHAAPGERVELLGPGFLPHMDGEWARARREEVEELVLAALEQAGDGRALIARAPYRESGYRLLMKSLAADGNVAEALRVYEDLRVLLRDELGTTPAPDIVALHRRLLGGDVPLPAILAPADSAFIGRAAELEDLRTAWAAGRRRFVLLSGPPGIGKTRLTAELLADLRRDRLLHTVALDGLDEHSVAALIAAQAGHAAPSALVHTVHEETDGNPFFVEEVVRHLLESGRWTDTLTPGQIGVPEGVKDVLSRRLARLSEPCRAVLLDAAVLGREFDPQTLDLMQDADTVVAALEEALEARLIVETPDGYAFTHALVRETLYGTISAPRRQRMHASAAAAIEQRAPGSLAALARHHRLAGPAGDAAKAIDFSLRAGESARELFAWEDASAHWEGALAVMDRTGAAPAFTVRLLVGLAELMAVTGDLGRQIAHLERALGLYHELGDEERTAQINSRLGQAYSLIDSIYADHLDIRRAFRHFAAARPVLERGPVRKALGHLETGVSTALTYGLQIPQGIEVAARAIEIAEQLGDEALWAGATEAYGWHRIIAGDLSEGFDAQERAFVVADKGQRPFLAWMASNIRGQMTWGIGDPTAGGEFFARAGSLRYAQHTAYRRETADGIGRCYASRGDVEQARRLLSDARPSWVTHSLEPLLGLWDGRWDAVEALALRVLDTSRRNGNRWDEWASFHLAARVAYLRGDGERTGMLLERALEIVSDGGADYFAMWVLPDLARVRAETGRVEHARAHVERCRAILDRGEDWRGRRGVVTVADAVVLAAENRLDDADGRFAEAQEILHRYRLPGEEAECLHEWGRALARAGDPRAAERLAEALGLYRRHGAGAAWIERVEADAQLVRV
jgi:DNA-binding SARP family transcriptional activator